MAKSKLELLFIFIKWFLLCFVVLGVTGTETSTGTSDQSNTSNLNPSQNPSPELSLSISLVLGRLEALENKHQKLEKSHAQLKERIKSSKKQVDQLKNENCVGEDVWLLTPPLRGRRGQKGEKGDSGVITTTGKSGDESAQKREKDGGQIQLTNGSPSQSPAEQEGDLEIPVLDPLSLKSCSDAMEFLPSPRSKTQMIYPHGNSNNKSLEVLCDFETDGGGWTIIQKRTKGPKHEFDRNWNDYENGFGSLDKNFWMGLENIHALTQNGDQELRIDLEDFQGNKKYAKYSSFSVSNASDFYRLSISGISSNSTAGDSMTTVTDSNNGSRFTAKNKGIDGIYWVLSVNCAFWYNAGGWWFTACGSSFLNGLYQEKGEAVEYGRGIIWMSWKGEKYSLAKTEMKIRKRKAESEFE